MRATKKGSQRRLKEVLSHLEFLKKFCLILFNQNNNRKE